MGISAPGFRLPAGSHPGAVRLQVADLQRSVTFYENTLGFRVASSADNAAYLTSRESERVLIELMERPGAAPVPPGGRLGLYHFAILVPDRPSLGRFLRHVIAENVRLGSADHVVSEALYLHDPDGLGIEVYADRPASAWEWPDGELRMTADPLDTESVLRAGGDTPWSGMPADTVIGHIHLHVGDLTAASDFYHTAFGLDKTHWTFPSALFLSAGGYHHHLGVNTWAPPIEARQGDARLLSWEMLLPDDSAVREAEAAMQKAGHSSVTQTDGWTITDPWGTTMHVRWNGAVGQSPTPGAVPL